MAHCAVGRLLRGPKSSPLRQSLGTLTQTRSYSKNAIPTFSPTSSPELDQGLTRFREELFIPWGLGSQQRNMMFRQKYADKLDTEPVSVSVGGEDEEPFLLRPMDPQSRPTKQEAVRVLSLMKTPKDWQNLLPFLAGLRMARRHLSRDRQEWLVRRAGQSDALGILVECAKRPDITGFYLRDQALVRRLFFEIHRKAQRGQFKEAALERSITLAKQFLTLMETPGHAVAEPREDPKKSPFVSGVMLELVAARALENGGGDDNRDVRVFASRLLGTWNLGRFNKDTEQWAETDLLLQHNVPIYNAMKLALQVKGIANDKGVASGDAGLKSRLNGLSTVIVNQQQKAPESLQQKPEASYLSAGLEQCKLLFKA